MRVQPGASKDEVVGWEDDVLRVRVRARAVEGKANKGVVELLAETLGLRPYQVSLVRGERSRDKLVEMEIPCVEELRARLGIK